MPYAGDWISALRNSSDKLISLVDGLDPGRLIGRSYCSEWTIAQVLSHIGSGAEIFSLITDAVIDGTEPPGREMFPSVWESWNAKTPAEQAEDSKGADRALVEQLESLNRDQLSEFRVSLLGMDLDAADFVGMRLSEHALHSWDIAVALDDSAVLAPDATTLLVDSIKRFVPTIGKALGGPLRVEIETTRPERSLFLSVDDGVSLDDHSSGSETSDATPATLQLPAEALVRLVAGRLDPSHTPNEVNAKRVDLDELRAVFPGF
jgi:uncharacterized protein (TIGR03083 family)